MFALLSRQESLQETLTLSQGRYDSGETEERYLGMGVLGRGHQSWCVGWNGQHEAGSQTVVGGG